MTNQNVAGLNWTNRKFVVIERVIGIREKLLGYSDYSVLAQLGFGLARAWLARLWLGWAVTIIFISSTITFYINVLTLRVS